ncbi:hypothetical protein V6N11_050461 [Hibiscus sabdariffa]|uniref:Uncharacterized protein n=1 Tax=Hibiscus sabdariffa TaxID=183260 RepID=A0ABR2T9W0_9ROSI
MRLKLENSFYVEPIRLAGELSLWWTKDTQSRGKLGGVPFNPNDAKCYFQFIDAIGLIDLPISGGAFTWLNQRSDEEAILEKLDRALCSLE